MPLETATYIADLNSSNPAATDSPAQADDHLRLLKGVLKAQFPAFTSAPLASTNAAVDAAAVATATGASVLADAGAFFKTNTTDGFTNPAAGEVDIKAGGVIVAKAKSDLSLAGQGAVSAATTVTAGSAFAGGTGQLVPSGATMIWWAPTLPTGYLWVNGAAVSRATYATLFAMFGTFYGAGDGSTTFNLPDLRDSVPVGQSSMGGVSAAGRITNYVAGVLGSFIGECIHLLTTGEMPSHNHGVTDTHQHQLPLFGAGWTLDSYSSGPVSYTPRFTGGTSTHDSTIATTGSIAINNNGGGGSHNNVQPSTICNYIIKT